MTDVIGFCDSQRIASARVKHQAAIEAEVQAGADADRLHLAAASTKRAADKALLGTAAEIEAAEGKRDAAEKAAQLASRVASARTAARVASEATLAGEIKQSYAGAVRAAVKARIAAVAKAADLVRQIGEAEAAFQEADRALQRCRAEGGVGFPDGPMIGSAFMDGNRQPITPERHAATLRGSGYDLEGWHAWMGARA